MQSKSIVLVGLMGCGKSSVGKQLARKSKRILVDVDAKIEQAAGMKISEIFAQKGEAAFRHMECEMIFKIMQEENQIVSTGGGAFQDETNRSLLLEKGVVVYLKAPVACLFERVKRDESRPLLQNEDPFGALQRLLEQREPFYAQAHFTVTVERRTPEQIATEIWRRYKRML